MLSLALAALMFSAAPTSLASAPFAQLPTHGAAVNIQWRWPDQQLFLDTLRAPVVPPSMAIGEIRALFDKGAGKRLRAQIAAGGDPIALAAARLKKKDATPERGALIWTGKYATMEVGAQSRWIGEDPAQVVTTDAASLLIWDDLIYMVDAAPEPVPDAVLHAAQLDWTYATTLLIAEDPVYALDPTRKGSGADRYDWLKIADAMATDPATALRLIDALDLRDFSDRDIRLDRIAQFLAAQGRVDDALAIYRRHQPMGMCSMDTGPAETARRYADLCYRAGRIGCFLQLQVRIMGDRFARVAASSYGERAAQTESKALVEAGVDARRFLRGMLMDFDAGLRAREGMNLWRLARSMHESGIDFASDLGSLASNAQLDPVNRHRATQALWLLLRRAREMDRKATAARFAKLELLPISQRWIEAVEAAQR